MQTTPRQRYLIEIAAEHGVAINEALDALGFGPHTFTRATVDVAAAGDSIGTGALCDWRIRPGDVARVKQAIRAIDPDATLTKLKRHDRKLDVIEALAARGRRLRQTDGD